MRCVICGRDHELLEPSFRRPDAVIALSPEERRRRVTENDDMCLMGPGGVDDVPRFFIRTVLPVRLTDVAEYTKWGFWVEIAEEDAKRAWDLWEDPRQAEEPSFAGRIANRVEGYPDTIGLPVQVQLTGPTSRPKASFEPRAVHPLADECRTGVTTQKVLAWLGERVCGG
jgi:hypothetical protein